MDDDAAKLVTTAEHVLSLSTDITAAAEEAMQAAQAVLHEMDQEARTERLHADRRLPAEEPDIPSADLSEAAVWRMESGGSNDRGAASFTASSDSPTDVAIFALQDLQTVADGYAATTPPREDTAVTSDVRPHARYPSAGWLPPVVPWRQIEDGPAACEPASRFRRIFRALKRRVSTGRFIWIDERVWMGLFSVTLLSVLLAELW